MANSEVRKSVPRHQIGERGGKNGDIFYNTVEMTKSTVL